MHPRRTQRAALLRKAGRVDPDRKRHAIRRAAAQQVAGGAGHVPRAAEDGVEEQHLAEPELGRRYQRRRLQGLEPARSDDALERAVQLVLGRLHLHGGCAGKAQPHTKIEKRFGKRSRPHDGSPSTLSFGLAAELNPELAPGSWFARRPDQEPA